MKPLKENSVKLWRMTAGQMKNGTSVKQNKEREKNRKKKKGKEQNSNTIVLITQL